MRDTLYINDPKLAPYSMLLTYAGKLVGRIGDNNFGTHSNLEMNMDIFINECFRILVASEKLSKVDAEKENYHCHSNRKENYAYTGIPELVTALMHSKIKKDEWEVYEGLEAFFKRVVLNIAVIEDVNIKYHFIPGEKGLYGSSYTLSYKELPYTDYLDYLEGCGYSKEDIEGYETLITLDVEV